MAVSSVGDSQTAGGIGGRTANIDATGGMVAGHSPRRIELIVINQTAIDVELSPFSNFRMRWLLGTASNFPIFTIREVDDKYLTIQEWYARSTGAAVTIQILEVIKEWIPEFSGVFKQDLRDLLMGVYHGSDSKDLATRRLRNRNAIRGSWAESW